MRTFLIIIAVIVYLGGLSTVIANCHQYENYLCAGIAIIIFISIFCAYYLYRKAGSRKTEWALAGLIGNLSTLIIFFVWQSLTDRGKKNDKKDR